MKALIRLALLIATSTGLVACGGGGSESASSGPITSTESFPLRAAFVKATTTIGTEDYSVTGTCGGSARASQGAATPATFEGQTVTAVTSSLSMTLTNCTVSTIAGTSTTYFNANWIPVGTITPGGDYEVFQPSISQWPEFVRVGDTAVLGTMLLYSNSSKAIRTGTEEISYFIEPETATTVIVNFVNRQFDVNGSLDSIEQSRHRISLNGDPFSLSTEIQFFGSSAVNFRLTRR